VPAAAGSAQIPEDAEMALGPPASGLGRTDVTFAQRPQPGRETIISNRELPLGEAKGAKD
jgi:hypothetical protein